MKASILRLVAGTFVAWLEGKMSPAGRPTLRTFEAGANEVINAAGESPDGGEAPLSVSKVAESLDWIMATMLKAYKDNPWAAAAIHGYWLHVPRAVPDMLDMIAAPPRPPAAPAGIDTPQQP